MGVNSRGALTGSDSDTVAEVSEWPRPAEPTDFDRWVARHALAIRGAVLATWVVVVAAAVWGLANGAPGRSLWTTIGPFVGGAGLILATYNSARAVRQHDGRAESSRLREQGRVGGRKPTV